MALQDVLLPYGKETVTVSIPSENLLGVYSPRDVPAIPDVKGEIVRALADPIQSKSPRELASGKKKVVIVADDITRCTPTEIITPLLLDEFNAAGVPDENITIIIALGTHRFMTDEEIVQKFGKETASRVTIKNHPFRDAGAHVDLGTTENGGQILVNREVFEADFKIGVGSIVPHHICGFSGGAKIIQPGVSGEATTAYTHLLSARAPRSYLGILDNPVRTEMDAIARKVGLNTILNTVLNRHGEVVGVFFGDVTAAFREGVKRALEVYAVELSREADIVLSSSHPCDLDVWQAHKTQYPTDQAVKEGGIFIIVTHCAEGVSQMHSDILDITCHSSSRVRDMVEAGQIHDEVGAALAIAWAQVKEREEVFIVSDGISAEEAARLGFTPFKSAQAAVDEALKRRGPGSKIAVLTHAPDMLPIVSPGLGKK
jgi:nickel-dependent lactate racemase